jgi:hypothetical protein
MARNKQNPAPVLSIFQKTNRAVVVGTVIAANRI